jgi:uncharacterized coiled-coil DUF342 family protein
VERELYFDLSPDEVMQRGQDLAQLHNEINQQIDDAKEAAKERKGQIRLLEIRRNALADTVRQRRELRLGAVDILDIGNGMVREVRKDPPAAGEIIRERAMTDSEKQRALPHIVPKEKEKAVEQGGTTAP